MLDEKGVLAALSTVEEPDLKEDLVTLKMIEDISIEGDDVSFTVVLTTPACPLKDKIKNDCVAAVVAADANAKVEINFTARVMGRDNLGIELLKEVKNIVLVSSGKGGVGKSTVAVNLAISLAHQGAKVGILDADIYGPSITTLLDLEGMKPKMTEVDGKSKILPILKYGIHAISIGMLINPEQAVVWRGPMASSALRQFFTDVEWGELDYLVVDLPPGTGDIHLTTAQLVKVAGAVVVTTPQKVAVDDARKGASMFRNANINIPILGIIENMSYFTPDGGDTRYHIFGKGGGQHLANEFEVDLLASLPLLEEVSDFADRGKPIALDRDSYLSKVFDELAGNIARKLSLQNANLPTS